MTARTRDDRYQAHRREWIDSAGQVLEDLALGEGFKETGEVYVRTRHGLRLLRAQPLSDCRPMRCEPAELPLDRIISEIIPGGPRVDWTLQAHLSAARISRFVSSRLVICLGFGRARSLDF